MNVEAYARPWVLKALHNIYEWKNVLKRFNTFKKLEMALKNEESISVDLSVN